MSAAERHRSTVIAGLSFDLNLVACSAGGSRYEAAIRGYVQALWALARRRCGL